MDRGIWVGVIFPSPSIRTVPMSSLSTHEIDKIMRIPGIYVIAVLWPSGCLPRPSMRSCCRYLITTACVSTYPLPRITPQPPTTCSISSSDPPPPIASRPSRFCLRMRSRIMTSSRGRSPDSRCHHVTPSRTASGTSSPSIYRGSRMISRTRVCSPIQRILQTTSRFKSTRS